MSITPKNWDTFQHYKDRSPAWIKLHRGLLDNVDYYRLSAEAGKALSLIWLLASEREGIIPEPPELAFRLRMSEELAAKILAELIERQFLVSSVNVPAAPAEQGATLAQQTAKANGFGSRHISDETKREVWERDGGKCVECDSIEKIEYDHKHPVSKGGNSETDNIQLLCRSCNRSKRTKVATQPLSRRSLEEEIEGERENIEQKDARDGSQKRVGDFRQAIVQAYAEANSPTLPNTLRAELWLAQGYQEDICLAVIAEIVRKKPTVGLNYFDKPIAEAHAKKAPPRKAVGGPPPIDWDAVFVSFQKFGHWSRDAGNDPTSPNCRAPVEYLQKYGFRPLEEAQ